MEYRILLDGKVVGQKNGIGYITEEGARLIWEAYTKMNPYGTQTMERREERGGVCWLSEIRLFKEQGFLPESFNWTDYMVRLENLSKWKRKNKKQAILEQRFILLKLTVIIFQMIN